MTATMTTSIQEIVETIRSEEDIRLHYCRSCSQGVSLVQELQPYLGILKANDYDAYREECNRLAEGLISFIDSFVKKTVLKYEPDYYLIDLGLSGVTDDLRDADALVSYLSQMDLSFEHKVQLNIYQRSIGDLILTAKKYRKDVLRFRRRERIRYYLDGPVFAGLIALGVLNLFAIIKVVF